MLLICTVGVFTVKDVSAASTRASYNDVFASLKGKGYSLNQAKSSQSTSFVVGDFVYAWGYLHDVNNNLYKTYGKGTCNITLSIYRPDGSCAHTYTYNNCDNNWIGTRLNQTGTWKIQSRITGALSGTNTKTITVKNRPSYNDVFASLKGSGYTLGQARSSQSTSFTKGQWVYVWGYLHDANNNLYKTYGKGTCNITLSIYRPNGSCAYTHTYNNSDNNWIGTRLDQTGTWKIQSKISGALTGTNTRIITVKEQSNSSSIQYAPYKGIDYTKQTNSSKRIAALKKAQRMVTVKWTSPVTFVTWCSSKGSYNTVKDINGNPSTSFIKGRTYVGIPYSMKNHSYDEGAWTRFIRSNSSKSNLEAYFYKNKKGTSKGMDCSYFVYLCWKAGGANISYKTTSEMVSDKKTYVPIAKKNMKPGDILLKNGHVMLFAGKSGSNYAVFEATASGSKTRYKVYTAKDISSYSARRYANW